MFKKLLSLSLAVALLFCFTACSSTSKPIVSDESSADSELVASSNMDGSKVVSEETTTASDMNSSVTEVDSSSRSITEATTKSNNIVNTTAANSTSTTASVNIPDQVIAIFGGESNENRAKLKTMGQQGWYPMYSTKTGMDITGAESFDLSSLKECKLTVAGLWKPNETVTDKDGNVLSGSWFAVRKDGFCGGDSAFTAAVKWVCPYDGTYKIGINYSGGSSAGYAEKGYTEGTGENAYFVPAADGLYLSAYINNKKVIGIDTWACKGRRADQTENVFENQKLKAGQSIVIVSDTKGNGGWDDPWWYVSAERVGNY